MLKEDLHHKIAAKLFIHNAARVSNKMYSFFVSSLSAVNSFSCSRYSLFKLCWFPTSGKTYQYLCY